LNVTSRRPDRVVVVGAAGFVGKAIVARLQQDHVEVLRLNRKALDLLAADAAERLSGHLRDGDVLVAAAAIAPCKTSVQLRDNISLALTIVEAGRRVKPTHVVNISSDAVYADSAAPLTESSPRAPDTLHGVMHLARELMFSGAFEGLLANLSPTLIYGAADPHNGYGPNRFRRLAAAGKPIILFGEGEERRDHVWIDDVADLTARVVLRRSVGALNIATGATAAFCEIAKTVAGLCDHEVAIAGSPRVAPMPHNGYRSFDIAGCRAAFPDFTYTMLEEGLARARREEAAMPA
jgi:nucleoside-diphosphate-sugar epimerase